MANHLFEVCPLIKLSGIRVNICAFNKMSHLNAFPFSLYCILLTLIQKKLNIVYSYEIDSVHVNNIDRIWKHFHLESFVFWQATIISGESLYETVMENAFGTRTTI